MSRHLRVAVIGAGAFGGWTALALVRRGAQVTLIDAWGAANARASSGGDTRIIRSGYGTRAHYTALAIRARQHWREFEASIGQRLFRPTGVLWLFDDSEEAGRFARGSAAALREHGDRLHELEPADASRRFPQIDFAGVSTILFEPDAGYLMARRACEEVVNRVESDGGTYRIASASSPVDVGGCAQCALPLTDGTTIDADVFVFACGPWLGQLFPDVIGRRVVATRQEVYYFGIPCGDAQFTDARLPVWIDIAGEASWPSPQEPAASVTWHRLPPGAAREPRACYGIPGDGARGFKLAEDTTGPEIDPTTVDRRPEELGVVSARGFLSRRFPALAAAPLVACEVCQYEASPDSELIVDRHPRAGNVWIVGGGSGHGFKLGPAIGEIVARQILDVSPVDPRFSLARFSGPAADQWQIKWT